jgi:pSer/pThr/pTyr-binding forkhead associated (FHA) protein
MGVKRRDGGTRPRRRFARACPGEGYALSPNAIDLFMRNCGLGPLEVTLFRREGGAAERHVFEQPFVLCGRAAGNDLCFEDGQVSRRHAYLQAVNGRVFVLDLGSRTGVHWPDQLGPSGWLEWDRPVRIGRAVLQVRRPEGDSRASAPTPADPLSSEAADPGRLPRAVFEVSLGAEKLADWRLNRALTLVGRSAGCKLRLRDGRVSRAHCALTAGPLGVWAVDLLSGEGTAVNGERVRWARLEDGDVLEVGPFCLRARFDAPPAGGAAGPLLLAGPPRVAALEAAGAGRLAAERSLLLPVIDQFSLMQQQMFEQFHQSMMMMAEMFSTLHREQMALVRDELGHMRRLTAELQALQAEQARGLPNDAAEGRSARALVGRRAAGVPDEKGKAPDGEERDSEEAGESRTAVPVSGPAEDGQREEGEGGGRAGEGPPAPPPAADVHDWLSRRIAALQEERQGRWQKIVNFVLGK